MWSVSKALHEPLDNSIKYLSDIPHTISYVIRKRVQIDNLNELPKEKRPPELMIWDGTYSDIEEWLDKVYGRKQKEPENFTFTLDDLDIEE